MNASDYINLATAVATIAAVLVAALLGWRAVKIAESTVRRSEKDYASSRADYVGQTYAAFQSQLSELDLAWGPQGNRFREMASNLSLPEPNPDEVPAPPDATAAAVFRSLKELSLTTCVFVQALRALAAQELANDRGEPLTVHQIVASVSAIDESAQRLPLCLLAPLQWDENRPRLEFLADVFIAANYENLISEDPQLEAELQSYIDGLLAPFRDAPWLGDKDEADLLMFLVSRLHHHLGRDVDSLLNAAYRSTRAKFSG